MRIIKGYLFWFCYSKVSQYHSHFDKDLKADKEWESLIVEKKKSSGAHWLEAVGLGKLKVS